MPPALREDETTVTTLDATSRTTTAVRPLHVAIVDEELPYPPTSGKRIRTLNLLLRLARRHRIAYFSHRNADPAEAERAAAYLKDNGIDAIVVDRAVPPKSGALFYARLAANLLSPLPYSATIHRSRALQKAVEAYDARNQVDLWQCEWTPYAQSLRKLPGARRLVVAHNVESLIWRRYFENEPNRIKRWYIGKQWRKFARFEKRVCAEATRVVAVTSQDARLLHEEFGARHVDVVDNGVDTGYFTPSDSPRDPHTILFLGSLDWRPNWDAVNLLLERVRPQVRALEPSARFVIVGRNPPESLVERVSRHRDVELFANVDDVRPYLASSAVLAVPLRIGGGSRLKILEALAAGLPVVSTRVGAEGLELQPGQDVSVVDDVEQMAAAIVECLRDPCTATTMAEHGRATVGRRYDWDTLALDLEQVWYRCASR